VFFSLLGNGKIIYFLRYQGSGGEALIILGSLFLIPIYFIFSFYDFIVLSFTSFFYVYISDLIHVQIHTKNSWLENYLFFLNFRKYHFQHHHFLKHNLSLGGLELLWDKLFLTNLKSFQKYHGKEIEK
jgi:sterol desaturase/sphingolipid hydroxylase (fatty acid hydroxylase superfamily)